MNTAIRCIAGRRAISILAPSLLALASSAPMLSGQTRGNTQTVPYNHLFSTSGQSMWGPGPATIFNDYELFRGGPPPWHFNPTVGDIYTIPSSVSDADWLSIKPGGFVPNDAWLSLKPSIPGAFAGKQIGGQISAFSKGHLQIVGVLNTADPGGVGVDYPVDIEIEFPEDNSFRDGEEVVIKTRYAPDTDGASKPRIRMVNPVTVFDLNLEFGFGAWAEAKLCFFDCWWFGLEASDFDFDKDGDGSVSFEELLSDTFNPVSSTPKRIFPAIDLPSGFSAGTAQPWQATIFQSTSEGELSFPVLDPLMTSLGIALDGFEVLPHGFSQIETAGCGVPYLAFINKACVWPGHGLRGIVDVPRLGIPCASPFPTPWPRDPRGKDGAPFAGFGVNDWGWGCAATSVPSQLLANGLLKANTTSTFAEVALDLDHWFQLLTSGLAPECNPSVDSVKKCMAKEAAGLAFKVPLGLTFPFDDLSLAGIPTGGAVLSYDIVSIEMPFRAKESRNFEFMPDLEVDIVFPRAVELWVTDPAGAIVVAKKTSTSVRFDVGNTLHVTYPEGLKDPMAGSTQYSLPNSFKADAGMAFEAGFREQLLKASVKIPSFTVWTSPSVDFCAGFHLGEWAEDVINEVGSWFGEDPVDVPDNCPVTIDISAPAIDVNVGPAFDAFQPVPLDGVTLLSPTTWTLGGFTPATGAPFTLDPENPSIAISTALEPGILNGLGPAGTLVQTLEVENTGDVRLLMTQVTDALSVVFPSLPGFTFNSVSSAVLTTSATFDGVGTTAALSGTDILAVGQKSYVSVQFQAAPGNVYQTLVAATGQSPIGTDVFDDDAGSFAVYAMDIDQDKLNGPGSPSARLPLHVLDSPDLPIMDIVPESVKLDGVPAVQWDYVKRGGGAKEIDVVFQFSQAEVWEKAQARLTRAAQVASLEASRGDRLSEVEIESLAAAILNDASIGDDLRIRADALGNADGRLDLGDLRAALIAASGAGGGPALAPPHTDAQNVHLPLTGVMNDGTPFVAEDSILVY